MRPARDFRRDLQARLAAEVRALVRTTGGLALLTLGCADKEEDSGSTTRPTDAEICAGQLPEGWTTGPVYIAVPLDTPCPTNPTVADTTHPSCCTPEVTEVVCGYSYSDEDQTSTTYGFHPSENPTVDVCWYNAAFSHTDDYGCCGRPLLEQGRVVVAETRSRARRRGRRVEVPAEVGGFWLKTALAEHASIASFAKFSLDLLRLGAPPALLADAARATRDEVAHARAAFRITNRTRGNVVSPGALPITETNGSPQEIAVALVREGCVGETLAVLDAAERLAFTTEPAVRRALQAVIADESRHAALAWRALHWILGQHPELSEAVAAAFAEEARRIFAEPLPSVPPTPIARAWGLPDVARQARVFQDGWNRIISPAVAELLSPATPATRPSRRSRRAEAQVSG